MRSLAAWGKRMVGGRLLQGGAFMGVRNGVESALFFGISRRLARILAGIFALFVGTLVCAGVLFPV